MDFISFVDIIVVAVEECTVTNALNTSCRSQVLLIPTAAVLAAGEVKCQETV